MAHRFTRPERSRVGIEQEDALLSPLCQVAVGGWRNAQVILQFLKDVDQGEEGGPHPLPKNKDHGA